MDQAREWQSLLDNFLTFAGGVGGGGGWQLRLWTTQDPGLYEKQ